MVKRIVLMLLLVGLTPNMLNAHEFYISITTIQHHAETKKLSIRIKIFVNDLEESIFQEQGVQLGLWKNTPIENAQFYVEEYVCANFSILVNGNPIPLDYIRQKVENAEILEDHVIICELEASNVPAINSIQIHNSLLLEAFDSQANIVNIRANGIRNTINLDKRIPEDRITYH